MTINLQRFADTAHGTIGRLSVPQGAMPSKSWFTIEPRADAPYPHVPAGTYHMKLDVFYGGDGVGGIPDYPAYELDVPGRSEIKIHAANKASQLRGCIAPGRALGVLDGVLAVLESRKALAEFMAAMGGVTDDWIVIQAAPKGA